MGTHIRKNVPLSELLEQDDMNVKEVNSSIGALLEVKIREYIPHRLCRGDGRPIGQGGYLVG